MKQPLFLILFFAININAQNTNIKKSLDTFFEGLNTRDTLKIQSVCMPNFTLRTIEENGIVSNLVETPTTKFFKSIALIPAKMTIEERILRHQFMVDGTMAMAWLPYEFYVNDKLSHSGVNVFMMHKDDQVWKVVSIVDTRRKPLI